MNATMVQVLDRHAARVVAEPAEAPDAPWCRNDMTVVVCRARQLSCQMVCADCDLVWDVNDPAPPACRWRQAS
jgi:hypothetical protein